MKDPLREGFQRRRDIEYDIENIEKSLKIYFTYLY
jgi:hypothetical protein